MIAKYCENHDSLRLSFSSKSFFAYVLLSFFLMFSITGLAKTTAVYGPTKNGDTLWKIARKNLPDRSYSIEQYVYAIYATNPKAFQSGNINFLLKGVSISLPSVKTISMTSSDEALKRIGVLQSYAKKLSTAQENSNKFNKQISRYQKQLKRSRRNSSAWKRAYRRLSRAKRNLGVSKRSIANINKLFRDTATIKAIDVKEKSADITQVAVKPATNDKSTKQVLNDKYIEPVPSTYQITKGALHHDLATKQGRLPQTSNTFKPGNWWGWMQKNFILIGASVNGLILIFVLFKLFERKEEE